MKEKLLYTFLAQALGTAIGYLSSKSIVEKSMYLAISLCTFALLVYISCKDPGSLTRKSEGYIRRVSFANGGYVVIEEEGCLVARLVTMNKEKRMEPFCVICGIFRPQNTVHCKYCNACIAEMDHHCPWVGNCIGKNNYNDFISLLALESIRGVGAVFLCSSSNILPLKMSWHKARIYAFLLVVVFLTVMVGILLFYFIILSIKGTTARMFCLKYKRRGR